MGLLLKNFVLLCHKLLKRDFPKIRWNGDPNGTHAPFLKHLLGSLSEGETGLLIVEIGSGLFSTPLLADALSEKMSKSNHHRLISLENSNEWGVKVKALVERFEPVAEVRVEIPLEPGLRRLRKEVNQIDVLFVDSSPWESRVQALEVLEPISDVVVVHDVDFFPRNGLFGTEVGHIKYPKLNFRLEPYFTPDRVGSRDYSEMFTYWVEIFPEEPAGPTGPPTLIASNRVDVRNYFQNQRPRGIYLMSDDASS